MLRREQAPALRCNSIVTQIGRENKSDIPLRVSRQSEAFSLLYALHPAKEDEYCRDKGKGGVSEDDEKMRECAIEIARHGGALELYCVNERERVGNLFEYSAHKIEVKPHTREPGGEVGEERSADSAHLLIVQYTAEKQAERDE